MQNLKMLNLSYTSASLHKLAHSFIPLVELLFFIFMAALRSTTLEFLLLYIEGVRNYKLVATPLLYLYTYIQGKKKKTRK